MNDKTARNLSDYEAPYEVIHAMLRGGNSKEIARHLGKNQISVDLWGGNPEENRHPMPITMVIPFTLVAKDTTLIEWFCAQAGGVFIKIPDVPATLSKAGAQMSKLAQEFADVLEEFSTSIEDGKITNREREQIVFQTADLIRQAIQFKRLFE